MAQVKDILVHVEVEIAGARRICHRDRKKHSITKGIACLAVYESDGQRRNYCGPCAKAILTKAKIKLAGIEEQLKGTWGEP
jgi:hypothetical protein